MASVHPSRAGMVPETSPKRGENDKSEPQSRIGPGSYGLSRLQGLKAADAERRKERRRRDKGDGRDEGRRQDWDGNGERREENRRGGRRETPRGDTMEGRELFEDERRTRHERPPHLDSGHSPRRRHDRYRGDDSYPGSPRERSRRSSPSYRPYKDERPEPAAPVVNAPIRLGFDDTPPLGLPPWKPTMPPRGGRAEREPPADLELRREQREQAVVNIWPDSPPKPYKELVADEKDKDRSSRKKSRKRRSKRYSSSSDDSEDDYERRRRERRRERREKRRRREREESDEERRERRRDDASRASSEAAERTEGKATAVDVDDGPDVGPQAPAEIRDQLDREAFHHLLPGEGEAMAGFLQRGERIPRRGEIGLDASRIQQFEDAGYVMSGSRHQRMNAVRLRKEGQVINAEEKRAMLKLQKEHNEQKEGAIISQFKEMMDERLKVEERREREEREIREGREGREGREREQREGRR